MGASFAMALKKASPDMTMVGYDHDPLTARKAMDRGIASAADTNLAVIDIADVIVVAVPILAMRDVFTSLRPRVEGKVVTDMASTKATVMEWAAAAGIDLVGGHPMCGREAAGIDAAEHDRLVAGVSHAALLLSVGYVLALSGRADWPDAAHVAAGGFRDMSRLAAGDPELSAGITRTNRDNLLEQLDGISHSLSRLRRHLEADDGRLVELFEEARAVRERWSRGQP